MTQEVVFAFSAGKGVPLLGEWTPYQNWKDQSAEIADQLINLYFLSAVTTNK